MDSCLAFFSRSAEISKLPGSSKFVGVDVMCVSSGAGGSYPATFVVIFSDTKQMQHLHGELQDDVCAKWNCENAFFVVIFSDTKQMQHLHGELQDDVCAKWICENVDERL